MVLSKADAQRLQRMFERGLAAQRAGRVEEAAGCYRAVLARVPHASSLLNLGRLLSARRDHQGALGLFENALAMAPDEPERLRLFAAAAASLGLFERSLPALEKLVALDGSAAGRWQSLGWTLLHLDRADEAVEALARAEQLAPDDPDLLRTYASALFHAGRRDEAAAACARLSALLTPEQAGRYMVDPPSGEPLAACDLAAVERIYEGSAQRYDNRTVRLLRNRTPELLMALLDAAGPALRFGDAVDLGCGTGLLGVRLRDRVERLIGVDVSPAMIAKAERKQVYDGFSAGGLVEFLETGDERFELFTASDVLIYVGDLWPVVAGVARRARAGALFLFSTERSDEAGGRGYRLNAAGRFTHDTGYVTDLAAAAGLVVVERSEGVIRHDHVHPVAGDLFLLRAG